MSKVNSTGVRLVVVGFFGALFIAALWLWWGIWGVGWIRGAVCPEENSCADLGQVGDVFGGVNAFFAGLAFSGVAFSLELARRSNSSEREWQHDKEFVDQICSSYKWAFDALTKGDRTAKMPVRDRLAWLSAARHLLRAEKLSAEIKTNSFKAIRDEHREYWRTQFHLLLSERLDISFFANDAHEPPEPEPYLEYRSLLVIEHFISAEDWKDPIDDVDAHAMIERKSWGNNAFARSIERYFVQTLSGFLLQHLKRFPQGRLAKEREAVVAAQQQRQQQE